MAYNIGRPEYIDFLLSPETPLDFHVSVGLPELELERIGAIKWMLIARSKVLRAKLLEKKDGEHKTRELTINDLEPETFKFFLTYVYGHDEIASLEFEDSIKLLDAAQKYDVNELKTRLATIIIPNISVQNVALVLNNRLICNKNPLLWDTATEIVQFMISSLIKLPQYLTLSVESMVFILKQDSLEIKEVDLWTATLKWAKHKLGFGDGCMPSAEDMRRTMGPLLKHTRLCTLQPAEIGKQVLPAQILTPFEFDKIRFSIGKKEVVPSLTTVCNKIDPRRGANYFAWIGRKGEIEVRGNFDEYEAIVSRYLLSTRYLSTIRINSIELAPGLNEDKSPDVRGYSNVCLVAVEITVENPHGQNPSYHFAVGPEDFNNQRGEPVIVPIDLPIEPRRKNFMKVTVRCSGHQHPAQWFPSAEQTLVDSTDHLRVIALPQGHSVYNHIKKINYEVVRPLTRGD